jgi:hypothetical protein
MVIPRELLRCNYQYRMFESLEPGEYSLVIRSRGQEITRRKFTLAAKGERAVGN